MNTKRLFIGDIYDKNNELLEKDVLLVRFNNSFIKASMLKNKIDLISFYTFLKYYPINNTEPLNNYIYKTKDEYSPFILKKSLRRYLDYDNYMDFNRFLSLTILYNENNKKIYRK